MLMFIQVALEQFSVECRKTKTKVITLANHPGHRQSREPIKTRNVCSGGKARVKVYERVALVSILFLIG